MTQGKDNIFGETEEAKAFFQAFVDFFGDEVIARKVAMASRSKMESLVKNGVPLPSGKLKQLKLYLKKAVEHSAFSYIQECLIDKRYIDPLRLLEVICQKENIQCRKEEIAILLERQSSLCKDFKKRLTYYVELYLRWYCGSNDTKKNITHNMEKADNKRLELYWLLREKLFKIQTRS